MTIPVPRHLARLLGLTSALLGLVPENAGALHGQERPRLILDADTANEIDDLYAITRMLRQDRYELIGLNSAQWFHALSGTRTVFASQTMNEDLLRLHGREDVPALLGADMEFGLPWGGEEPRDSAAARFIIDEARKTPDGAKLVVVCIGASTNLASALKLAPDIAPRIRAYLMGFRYDATKAAWNKSEFNIRRDLNAADHLLNCEELELHVMDANVSFALKFDRDDAFTRQAQMGELGAYLTAKWKARFADATTWVMWDLALVQALLHPEWAPEREVETPRENRTRKVWVYESIDAQKMQEDFWMSVGAGEPGKNPGATKLQRLPMDKPPAPAVIPEEGAKPIVIITQDGEVDDRSSFVRLLLYTPDMDLRGIIATNSKWQREGHGLGWIQEAYSHYAEVLDNLRLHQPSYPDVAFLRSITVPGNEDPVHLTGGAPYADSQGADLIQRELLKEEEAPVHINCWGGANTVAHALWRLKKDHPERYAGIASRVRLYCIDFQDEAGDWIVKNLPEILIIRGGSFHMTWNYHVEKPLQHNPYPELMSARWLNEHVKTGHGPLGAWYPQDNISEGDTPAFLHFVDNGLRAFADYSLGGWGGRYSPVAGRFWSDATDDGNDKKALWRWCPATQADFAARMDWCVLPYEAANHPPRIDSHSPPRSIRPGERVDLKATASDPDGDQLYYHWWHYPDPSGMRQRLKIDHETAAEASFQVPSTQTHDIHIILEVTDDGQPALKRYQRLIFPLVRE